jgi:hypothetical protein
VETPDFIGDPVEPDPALAPRPVRGAPERFWLDGDQVTWVAGLVLAVSAFTDWYAGQGVGVKLAVIGWHTGVLGKLVFFIGFAVVATIALRVAGMGLPASAPESLVILALGALSSVFVLIRVISIPDTFFDTAGRGIGIYISLIAAVALIGLGYMIVVLLRMRRVHAYQPVAEDWIWHTILPLVAYVSLAFSAFFLWGGRANWLFCVGADALLLLYVGIHNAWDTATWMAVHGGNPPDQSNRPDAPQA